MVRMTFLDVTHPEDRELSHRLVRECVAGTRPLVEMEKRYLHKTGRVVWGAVRAVPLCDAAGVLAFFLTHIQDITERKRADAALQQAHDELEQKVNERTVQLRSLDLELTRAEQRERRRVAYVLHEDLLQSLAAVKIRLDELRTRGDCESQELARKAALIMDDAIRVSRSLTMELDPPVLRELGLVSALRWLAEHMQEQFSLAVEVEAGNDIKVVSDELRVFLFHAVRELLFNVVKHAGVQAARVRLVRRAPDRITIEVGDEGRGFERGTSESGGFGLFSIRERAMLLGGEVQVASVPGAGTRVTLTVPSK